MAPVEEAGQQKAHVQQFLNWLLAIVFVSVPPYLGIGAFFHLWPLALVGGVLMAFGAGLLVARLSLHRTTVQRVVVGVCTLMFGVILAFALIMPLLLPILTIGLIIIIIFALPHVSKQALRMLCFIDLGVSVLLIALTQSVALFAPLAADIVRVATLIGVPTTMSIALLLLWQHHTRLSSLLSEARRANEALHRSQTSLADEVAERTADLSFALAELEHRTDAQTMLLAEVQQQRAVIRELGVPVLPINRTTLIMPLVGALDSQRLQDVREQALQTIGRTHAKRLLLDITGVPLVDTLVAKGLLNVIEAARLLGAESLLIGVRPEVAQAMVTLGVPLDRVRAYPDLQRAIEQGVG